MGAGNSCCSVFAGLLVTCISCFLSNLVSSSVKPLMYGRVANPCVSGGLKTTGRLSKAYILKIFNQRTFLTFISMNPGYGSSIFLNSISVIPRLLINISAASLIYFGSFLEGITRRREDMNFIFEW